jgi:hypothetical protein
MAGAVQTHRPAVRNSLCTSPRPEPRCNGLVLMKLSAHVAKQIQGEREQSDLYFEALRRMLPAPQ